MYNRYVPNDTGAYTRVVESPAKLKDRDTTPPPYQAPPQDTPPPREPHMPPPEKKPFSIRQTTDGLTGILRTALDKVQLQDIDTGDLMILALLFFLFREDAEEEVLFALGLLLIL